MIVYNIKFESKICLPPGATDFLDSLDSVKIAGSVIRRLKEHNENKGHELIEHFKKRNIAVSSIFPRKDNDYFFPRPVIPEIISPQKENKKKEISRFINKDTLEKIINENELEKVWDILEEQNGKEVPKIHTTTRLRNTIERTTFRSIGLFEISEVHTEEMFFLVQGEKKAIELFDEGIQIVKDVGLSRSQSIGYGKFEITSKEKFEIKQPKGEGKMLLSKYIPQANELKDGWYHIKEIKGITRNGFHFREIYALTEASIVLTDSDDIGQFLDLETISYSINGIGFYIKCPFWRPEI